MDKFVVMPKIITLECFDEFIGEFNLGERDLIITSERTDIKYLKKHNIKSKIIDFRKYGQGEPTDEMIENMYNDILGFEYDRVIGIGGGSILDVSKLFALESMMPLKDLFTQKIEPKKIKELILIPTTCGTGSEVTNISISVIEELKTKAGLANDELYADYAVIVPELLESLPYQFFATSSLDALVHAIESYLSPLATILTEMYSVKAIEMILEGYSNIALNGKESRKKEIKNFLIASLFAGIGFGNAGCGPVHAISYPLGTNYHVPHGESNYTFLVAVLKEYNKAKPEGKIKEFKAILAKILQCNEQEVFEKFEELLLNILECKKLTKYGVKEEELPDFAKNVIENQQRLLTRTYSKMDYEVVLSIYRGVYS